MPGRITRIEFHNAGFNELRRSPEVRAELERRGSAIAEAAGGAEDFEVVSTLTKSRARVVVVTATARAKQLEAEDRALTSALDAGRS